MSNGLDRWSRREPFARPGQAGFARILLAIDESLPSQNAVATAAGLARAWDSEILVVHVRERQVARHAVLQTETPEDANETVNRAVYELGRAGVRASGILRSAGFGRVPREIVDIAGEQGAELIVIGSRGLSCLRGFLQSSVSHRVLHLARVPVLVVPA